MKNSVRLFLSCNLIYWTLTSVQASPMQNTKEINSRCNVAECSAGTKVTSYAKKDDPFWACPTKELSEYTNFAFTMALMTYQISGKLPNISPITGEPEFQGETKTFLTILRERTGLKTLDQATAMCIHGRHGLKLTVANLPKDGTSIYVFDEKTKTMFWMPKANLNVRSGK